MQESILHGFMSERAFTKASKVEYELTELGEKLLPLILTIEHWGEENRLVLIKDWSKIRNFKILSDSDLTILKPQTSQQDDEILFWKRMRK